MTDTPTAVTDAMIVERDELRRRAALTLIHPDDDARLTQLKLRAGVEIRARLRFLDQTLAEVGA